MRYLLALFLLALAFPAQAAEPPVAPHVDLDRYLGTWYEIASIPQRFSKGCTHTTATYSKRDDGDIKVRNRCLKDGEESSITGKAWVVDTQTNAKLKVRFFWPFSGDYWVLAIADDYGWALVGGPERKTLWVLSRTNTMPDELYAQIVEKAKALGFDVSKLQTTKQD
jgi:apolipoprotein D and lipocalin family protein